MVDYSVHPHPLNPPKSEKKSRLNHVASVMHCIGVEDPVLQMDPSWLALRSRSRPERQKFDNVPCDRERGTPSLKIDRSSRV